MNGLLVEVDAICQQHRLEEKVLLVPSWTVGREALHTLARDFGGWVNLRAVTAQGLAMEVAGPGLAAAGLRFVGPREARGLVQAICRRLQDEGGLAYYRLHADGTGLVSAIHEAVQALRGVGLTSATLEPACFEERARGEDLARILAEYERRLQEQGLVDGPGLTALALEAAREGRAGAGQALYLLPDCLDLTPLEQELLELLAGPHLYRLSSGGRAVGSPATDLERLAWLAGDAGSAPPPVGDGSVEVFAAHGVVNEAREVLRRVHGAGVPFDQVAVAWAAEEYVAAFQALAQQLGVPLTVLEGFPAAMTRPGRVLRALLDWVSTDFSDGSLLVLVREADPRGFWNGQEAVPVWRVRRLLDQARVGRGRERYRRLLELADSLERREELPLEEAEDEEAAVGYGQEAAAARRTFAAVDGLLQELPGAEGDGGVELAPLLEGLARVLERLSPAEGETDRAARGALAEALATEARAAARRAPLGEALLTTQGVLETLRVGAEASRPGAVQLMRYDHLPWCSRPLTFFVGLDADTFPGPAVQNPALLDSERERLDARLLTASAQRARRERVMAAAVASRVGRVVFSFAGHDVVENRACFPSLLVLQVHRLLTGNPAADFSDLQRWLGAPAAFAPAAGRPALDAGEWWLAGGLECRPEELRPAVQALYPGLARADAAAAAQAAGQATAYDGMVQADAEALDPRRNPGLVLSPTMLETLAACPFAYFLRHVLGVRPPEGLAWDPERWLQANERGSLLHELYCRFMRRVTARGERPEAGRHRQEILEVAEELIARYRQEIPPLDEVAFASEARDIRRAAELFLEAQALLPAGEALAFEVPFGAGADRVAAAGLGSVEPVEIPLGDGSLRLRGVIDRIDRLDDGAFAVWDYKTGSAARYEGEGHLQQGRLLQHALYALAAESVLRGNGHRGARVRTAGYLFPTERGEGRLIARDQSQREPLYRALECLLDILAQGAFIPGDDASRCGFCDYAGVCGGQEAVKRSQQLLEEAGDPRLEPWRRLMTVE